MEEKYQKLLGFIQRIAKINVPESLLIKRLKLTELDGDNAEDIFINGTDFMEADLALKARKILKEVNK